MAKPPSSAPVLFDVQSESSTIKQGKDGSYKLVMEDVETVHWETDNAEAEDGYYSAKKYAKSYDTYYGKDAEVSAYATFTLADGSKEKCKFTVTDVKYNQTSNKLVYDIVPANKKQADKITGLEGEVQAESAFFSIQRTRWRPDWMPNGRRRDLRGAVLKDANLRDADLLFADLRGADLRDANLRDADLRGGDLRDADMRDADLLFADLRDANLRDADLTGADLIFAPMWRADLRDASLIGANMRGAELRDASLIGVNMRGAELRGADLGRTDLRGADLLAVRGLDQATRANLADWFVTTCPDGSMNPGSQPCS